MAMTLFCDPVDLLIKENTVKVSVNDANKFTAGYILQLAEEKLGVDSVLAIVKCNGSFDVTVVNKDFAKTLAAEGLSNGEDGCHCFLVGSKIKLVSFMHIPVYTTDEQILKKLQQWGVNPAGDIIRKTVDFNGKKKFDGTRFLKVNFPDNVNSLPYATIFDGKSYSVRHDDQEKVCFPCFQPGHLVSHCPDMKCFRCKEGRHRKKSCVAVLCQRCNLFDWKCKCSVQDENLFFVNDDVIVTKVDEVKKVEKKDLSRSEETVVCRDKDVMTTSIGSVNEVNIIQLSTNTTDVKDTVPDVNDNKSILISEKQIDKGDEDSKLIKKEDNCGVIDDKIPSSDDVKDDKGFTDASDIEVDSDEDSISTAKSRGKQSMAKIGMRKFRRRQMVKAPSVEHIKKVVRDREQNVLLGKIRKKIGYK